MQIFQIYFYLFKCIFSRNKTIDCLIYFFLQCKKPAIDSKQDYGCTMRLRETTFVYLQ